MSMITEQVLVNQGYIITFHSPVMKDQTKSKVGFKSKITTWSDEVTVNKESVSVFGRIDPIHWYSNTTRKISVSFDITAESIEEAASNLSNLKKLQLFCYPTFKSVEKTQEFLINQPPIIGIQFKNLIGEGVYSWGNLRTVTSTFQEEKYYGADRKVDPDLVSYFPTSDQQDKSTATSAETTQEIILDEERMDFIYGFPGGVTISPAAELWIMNEKGKVYPFSYNFSFTLDVIHKDKMTQLLYFQGLKPGKTMSDITSAKNGETTYKSDTKDTKNGNYINTVSGETTREEVSVDGKIVSGRSENVQSSPKPK